MANLNSLSTKKLNSFIQQFPAHHMKWSATQISSTKQISIKQLFLAPGLGCPSDRCVGASRLTGNSEDTCFGQHFLLQYFFLTFPPRLSLCSPCKSHQRIGQQYMFISMPVYVLFLFIVIQIHNQHTHTHTHTCTPGTHAAQHRPPLPQWNIQVN